MSIYCLLLSNELEFYPFTSAVINGSAKLIESSSKQIINTHSVFVRGGSFSVIFSVKNDDGVRCRNSANYFFSKEIPY